MRDGAKLVLEFLSDHSILQAIATAIGPLAIFVAPTEEIEAMLNEAYADEFAPFPVSVAEAPQSTGLPELQTL